MNILSSSRRLKAAGNTAIHTRPASISPLKHLLEEEASNALTRKMTLEEIDNGRLPSRVFSKQGRPMELLLS